MGWEVDREGGVENIKVVKVVKKEQEISRNVIASGALPSGPFWGFQIHSNEFYFVWQMALVLILSIWKVKTWKIHNWSP